ncbi:hypothetical protein U9M48_041076 [Paspalum notatum var. saurae]|uniref:Uncharacterized protein n=1 Tax=Paspalum notatum var. saurae TaxID=547442 RepID=A0AAQ3XEV7_PASNO
MQLSRTGVLFLYRASISRSAAEPLLRIHRRSTASYPGRCKLIVSEGEEATLGPVIQVHGCCSRQAGNARGKASEASNHFELR